MNGLRRLLRAPAALGRRLASTLRICYLRVCFPGLSIDFACRIGPGCDVRVGAGGRIVLRQVMVGRNCQIIAGPGAVIEMGPGIVGPNSLIVARERIIFGPGSSMAEMSVVRDSDHVRPDGAPLLAGHHVSAPVIIGDDVWLAGKVTVLRGVTIGHRANVGAGAVVTRDVPADTTVGGVPAVALTSRAGAYPFGRQGVAR
jgi:acetyltransferase-like isoleucine patch superfamily enzyme